MRHKLLLPVEVIGLPVEYNSKRPLLITDRHKWNVEPLGTAVFIKEGEEYYIETDVECMKHFCFGAAGTYVMDKETLKLIGFKLISVGLIIEDDPWREHPQFGNYNCSGEYRPSSTGN